MLALSASSHFHLGESYRQECKNDNSRDEIEWKDLDYDRLANGGVRISDAAVGHHH